MIYVMCCVRDRAADIYGQPFFSASLGMAQRGFADEINRVADNNMLNKHPDDFDLYHLGSYDDIECVFNLLPKPRQLAIGKELVMSK